MLEAELLEAMLEAKLLTAVLEAEVQKHTDAFIKVLDERLAKKEQEVLKV